MSVRPILKWPDNLLAQVCRPAAEITDETRKLAGDMLDTMYDAKGRGLAAPQVGVLSRVFVMDVTWKEGAPAPMVFVNPDVVAFGSEVVENAEVCLSIPDTSARVVRPKEVRMTWSDLDGARHDQLLSGPAAICAQHEFDHLNGIVTFDRVDAAQRADLLSQFEGI